MLQGWRPNYWKLLRSVETGSVFRPEFGPYTAVVPGSVHTTLKNEGIIPDWNKGRQSLSCEWIEHRQWEFFTDFKENELPTGKEMTLYAEGLDYSGCVLVDGNLVTSFAGALLRHSIRLGKILSDGRSHRLSLIFDLPPEEQGQVGVTSHSRYFKPRYSFSWDWCVRLVPVGISDKLTLVVGPQNVEVLNARTETTRQLQRGRVIVQLHNPGNKTSVRLRLQAPRTNALIVDKKVVLGKGAKTILINVRQPEIWWPNGSGDARCYRLEISSGGDTLFSGPVGFKHVRWLPCAKAPSDARPLLCEVNGKPLFLQGVNWTPQTMDYPAATDADCRKLVLLYKSMGCNLVRVWGGGYLEREIFYRECDAAGLMVWQEFPLSSSGVESEAPRGRKMIRLLEKIVTDYVRRRSSHPCMVAWCGGNELQKAPASLDDIPAPLNEGHPAIAAMARIVKREQPEIRFFPTSPSGPLFYAHRCAMGTGRHHHVHGPWDRVASEAEWQDYWKHDDSLLRAETGVAGASSEKLLRRYAEGESIWPPSFTNPWWRHSSAWWLQWELFENELRNLSPSVQIKTYIKLSQERQAKFLALAAISCKRRFPTCAGFIVWMGHDAFPCPSNTSLIDFDRQPKPAYYALQKVFLASSSDFYRR